MSALGFQPKIIGFVCHWWGYGSADLAGVSRLQYSTDVRLIRVMCTGRIDLAFLIRAFAKGADGVFIAGCHLNECNYITHGNFYALAVTGLAKELMTRAGLDPARLRMALISAGEGNRFAEMMNEFSKSIRELGPAGKAEGERSEGLAEGLAEAARWVPYLKMAADERLRTRLPTAEAYDDLFTAGEVEGYLAEAPTYYIDPKKCQACRTCARRCPVACIDGDKNVVHVIDQERCIRCGTCLEACPPKFSAVMKLTGEPAPAPLPMEERTIRRKKAEAAG